MLLLWAIRFFFFKLYESPKYLMGIGDDKGAVEVMHNVAEHNGTVSMVSLESLSRHGSVKSALSTRLDVNHVAPLFETRTLALSTSILISLWGK